MCRLHLFDSKVPVFSLIQYMVYRTKCASAWLSVPQCLTHSSGTSAGLSSVQQCDMHGDLHSSHSQFLLRPWPNLLIFAHFASYFAFCHTHFVSHQVMLLMNDGCIKLDNLVNSVSRKKHMALWLHTGMQLVVHLNQQCSTWQPMLLANCSLLSSPYFAQT